MFKERPQAILTVINADNVVRMGRENVLQCRLSLRAAQKVKAAIRLEVRGFADVLGIVDDEVTSTKVDWFLRCGCKASNRLLLFHEFDVSKSSRSPIPMSVCNRKRNQQQKPKEWGGGKKTTHES